MYGNQGLLYSNRQFSAYTKSSRTRTDKRTVWAARNTHYCYNQIGPLDHKMADNCVSLACTNTVFSTITKLIKSWKTSNKSYSYNLLNCINKMYTHDLFYLQQAWKVWLAPVYKQIQTTKSPLGFLTCAEMLMYVTAHWGCVDTIRVCTESGLWEKNPLPHQEPRPVSTTSQKLSSTSFCDTSHSVQSTCCQASPPATSVALLLMLIAFI